jgi:choice-of-anchor C domain-containing protein
MRSTFYAAIAAFLAVAAISMAVSGAASASATAVSNLVKNGGFEEPAGCDPFCEYAAGSTAMPHWVIGGNSIDLVNTGYFQAAFGSQSVDLSGSAPGSVEQTVDTTSGVTYRLKWYMAGNPYCGQPIKIMDVYWDGTLIAAPRFNTTGHSPSDMGWVSHERQVTAEGSTSTIEFADATPDMSECGATLDEVSLREVSASQ